MLKETTSEFIRFDGDALSRACMRFQNLFYHKFFDKLPPFDQVKMLFLWGCGGMGPTLVLKQLVPEGLEFLHSLVTHEGRRSTPIQVRRLMLGQRVQLISG